MSSTHFKQKKAVGRWFEAECEKLMLQKGMKVIDSDRLSYRQKKGWDREVFINGARCKVECKLDQLSEITGNVCIELSAINQSTSPIWLYGLPFTSRIDVYAMYLSDLAPYVESYLVRRLVGEFSIPAILVPKERFLNQSFVKKFSSIQALPPPTPLADPIAAIAINIPAKTRMTGTTTLPLL